MCTPRPDARAVPAHVERPQERGAEERPDQHAHHVRRDHVARPVEQRPFEIAQLPRAVRRRAPAADLRRQRRQADQREREHQVGRHQRHRHDRRPQDPRVRAPTQVHDQNVKAGSTDNPKTRVSTMKIETTVQATRPACAGVTRAESYHRESRHDERPPRAGARASTAPASCSTGRSRRSSGDFTVTTTRLRDEARDDGRSRRRSARRGRRASRRRRPRVAARRIVRRRADAQLRAWRIPSASSGS